jgi:O-antigen/teichoic acid export membrane protein
MSGLNYIGLALTLVLAIMRDQILLPFDNGVYSFGKAAVDTLFIVAALSFNISIIQADEDKEDLYSTAFVMTIGLSVVMVLLSFLTGAVMFAYGEQQIKIYGFLVLSMFTASDLFTILFSAYLEKQIQYKKIAKIKFLQLVTFPLVSYVLVYNGIGAWGMIIGQCAALTISFIGIVIVAKYPIGMKFNPKTAKWFMSMGWKLIFSRGMEVAFTHAGTLITDKLLGTTLQGSYSRALKYWEMAPQTVAPAVVTVALPMYSALKHNREKLSKAFTLVLYFMVRALMPFVLIFAILPEEFLLVLGPQWMDAVPVLRILAIGALFAPVFENMKQLVYAKGIPEAIVKVRFVQLVIFIPAMFLFVLSFGIEGAALAVVINYLVGVVAVFFTIRRLVSVEWKASIVLPFIWAAVSGFTVYLAPLPVSEMPSLIAFVLQALYLVGMFIVLELASEWKRLLEYWSFIKETMKDNDAITKTDTSE